MKRLYDLNKDELIKIVTNVVKNLSDEELEVELKRRKENNRLIVLKKNLINLKIIPHLREFITKHEEYIKSRTHINNFYDDSDFSKESKQFGLRQYENLFDDIQTFLREGYISSWIRDNDKIIYEPCEKCDYYEIRFYKEISTYTMRQFGTSQLCPDHFRHAYY